MNYGFLPRDTQALMHPRTPRTPWPAARHRQAAAVLDFVRERGVVHPREVDAQFQHGKAQNWFGGSSNASTQLLDAMHYRGQLRIARREGGVRLYAVRPVQAKYAPLPQPTFSMLVHRVGHGAPQWQHLCKATVQRARQRLPQVEIDGVRWLWPADEQPASRRHATRALADVVRLLAPFDPIVWDRRRFGLLWGWDYRFEAYTPAPKRVRGYYALPLLWRDRVIGWGNLAVQAGVLVPDIGFVSGRPPDDAGFAAALDDELQRVSTFLGLA